MGRVETGARALEPPPGTFLDEHLAVPARLERATVELFQRRPDGGVGRVITKPLSPKTKLQYSKEEGWKFYVIVDVVEQLGQLGTFEERSGFFWLLVDEEGSPFDHRKILSFDLLEPLKPGADVYAIPCAARFLLFALVEEWHNRLERPRSSEIAILNRVEELRKIRMEAIG